MIVNCPKCEFEQPIDEYCAQCGAPLRKLVELKKLERQNSSNLPIYLAAFAFFLFAGVWLSLQIDENKNPSANTQDTLAEPIQKNNNVVVSLKSTKIKVDRSKSAPLKKQLTQKKIEPNKADGNNLLAIKNQGISPKNDTKAIEEIKADVEETTKLINFKKLSLVSLKDCEEDFISGSLDKLDFQQLKNCLSTVSTKTFVNSGEIIEQGQSFETIINWSINDASITFSASFNSEDTSGSQSDSMSLDITEDTKAYLIPNSFLDLVDPESIKDEARTNILNASLFGFGENIPQTFFLLSE